MCASSWRPGTFLVIGVGIVGEMTVRSVLGVKAPTGRPARELSAGVVLGLAVVRSGLSKHVVSAAFTTWVASRPRSRSHRVAAGADVAVAKTDHMARANIQRARDPFHMAVSPSYWRLSCFGATWPPHGIFAAGPY